MHEPLPSKIGSSVSGSTIPAFRLCLLSRCLAMDAWPHSTIAAFRRHVTIFIPYVTYIPKLVLCVVEYIQILIVYTDDVKNERHVVNGAP
jgi:hypothetical protein